MHPVVTVNCCIEAFAGHHPLKLGPHHMHALILEALGLHINANSKELRSRIVNTKEEDGKQRLHT